MITQIEKLSPIEEDYWAQYLSTAVGIYFTESVTTIDDLNHRFMLAINLADQMMHCHRERTSKSRSVNCS